MEKKKPETPEEQWDAIARFARATRERPEESDVVDDEDDADESEAKEPRARTTAELNASLRAQGYDVERIDRGAAAFTEKMLAALHDEEVRRSALDEPAQSVKASRGADEPVAARPADERPDNVVRFPRQESRAQAASWTTMVLVAAVGATVALFVGATVAFRDDPEPVLPDRTMPRHPTPPHQPAPEEIAAKLRREAKDACDRSDWKKCSRDLDEAAGVDPEGERAPEVRALRQRVADGLVKEQKRQAPNP